MAIKEIIKRTLSIKRDINKQIINSFRKQGVRIGNGVVLKYGKINFEGLNAIGDYSKVSGTLTLGRGSFLGAFNVLNGQINIGRFCSLAPMVSVYGANHPVSYLSTYISSSLFENRLKKNQIFQPINIGNDVWIGHGAVVLPGVKINNGSIVAAGAIVNKDVDAYTIVAGNPAKPLKKRFSEQTIELLLKLEWWNLEVDQIKQIEYVFNIDFNNNEKLFNSELENWCKIFNK